MSWGQNCINAGHSGISRQALSGGLKIGHGGLGFFGGRGGDPLGDHPVLSLDATGWHFNFQLQQIAYNVYAYRPEVCALWLWKMLPNCGLMTACLLASIWMAKKRVREKKNRKVSYRNPRNLKSIHQNQKLTIDFRWLFLYASLSLRDFLLHRVPGSINKCRSLSACAAYPVQYAAASSKCAKNKEAEEEVRQQNLT